MRTRDQMKSVYCRRTCTTEAAGHHPRRTNIYATYLTRAQIDHGIWLQYDVCTQACGVYVIYLVCSSSCSAAPLPRAPLCTCPSRAGVRTRAHPYVGGWTAWREKTVGRSSSKITIAEARPHLCIQYCGARIGKLRLMGYRGTLGSWGTSWGTVQGWELG